MITRAHATVSLLSQRSRDFLDLIAPQWQFRLLKNRTAASLEGLQALAACNISTLGDLSTVTPLMLLALGAKVAGPPAEGAPFWEHLLQQERDAIKPLLQTILIEQINTALSQPQKPAPHQPTERTTSSTEGETGYSSLLIQPGEVVDQWSYPDSITIVNWPYGVKRQVAFAAGEICTTPLLAAPVRNALRAAGCDLFAISLSVLPLSVRTANACTRARITTLEALSIQTPEQLMILRNFGTVALAEVLHTLRDYLLPRLEAVPPDILVPPEPLHSFVVKNAGASPEQTGNSLTSVENDSEYSSLFIRIMKVLQQTLHPTAPNLSLLTPAGKGPIVHFSKGEVGNTPLLAKHIREALSAKGYYLNAVTLDRLPFAPRTRYLCEQGGITTLELLLRQTPNTLLTLPGFNHRYYQEIATTLLEYLTPWLRKLPLETLAPRTRIMPSLFGPDEGRTKADNLQAQNH